MTKLQLIQGDCLERMKEIPDRSVDAIIADLPYGTTACKWDTIIPFEPMWAQFKRVIKKRGAVVLFGSQPFTSALIMSNREWFKYCLVSPKSMKTGFVHAKNKPLKAHDDVSIFSPGVTIHKGQSTNRMTYNPQLLAGKPYTKKQVSVGKNRFLHAPSKANLEFVGHVNRNNGYRYPDMILPKFKQHNHVIHPTQKPVALLEYLIKTYTNAGETVLDPTMGSGTCGVAAVKTGRDFIGMETESDYFKIAETRIKNAAGEFTLTDKEKKSGQMTFL